MSAYDGPSEQIRFPHRTLQYSEDLYKTCRRCKNPTEIWNRICSACLETFLHDRAIKEYAFGDPRRYVNFMDTYWPYISLAQ